MQSAVVGQMCIRDSVKAQNVWGRGLAQILASVSPAMHDEFEIQYAMRAMESFGLVYYGCCEPVSYTPLGAPE